MSVSQRGNSVALLPFVPLRLVYKPERISKYALSFRPVLTQASGNLTGAYKDNPVEAGSQAKVGILLDQRTP